MSECKVVMMIAITLMMITRLGIPGKSISSRSITIYICWGAIPSFSYYYTIEV